MPDASSDASSDTLIAALVHRLDLVTENVDHFIRIPELTVESWRARPGGRLPGEDFLYRERSVGIIQAPTDAPTEVGGPLDPWTL